MRFIPTDFPGLVIIEPTVFRDRRGFFMESWRKDLFAQNGLDADFMQDNHARSEEAGVLRGLHFQTPPFAQAKLVRVTAGAVYDVAVDIRRGSPTFGRWRGVELSADNARILFIPAGFAHGYLTLTPGSEFQYKVDAPYAPDHDAGLAWDDPALAVDWPLPPGVERPLLSDKDAALPRLNDAGSPFVF